MVTAFQIGATLLGLLGALEGVRALSLWQAGDDEAPSSAGAAGLLLSIGLLFVAMARIDG